MEYSTESNFHTVILENDRERQTLKGDFKIERAMKNPYNPDYFLTPDDIARHFSLNLGNRFYIVAEPKTEFSVTITKLLPTEPGTILKCPDADGRLYVLDSSGNWRNGDNGEIVDTEAIKNDYTFGYLKEVG